MRQYAPEALRKRFPNVSATWVKSTLTKANANVNRPPRSPTLRRRDRTPPRYGPTPPRQTPRPRYVPPPQHLLDALKRNSSLELVWRGKGWVYESNQPADLKFAKKTFVGAGWQLVSKNAVKNKGIVNAPRKLFYPQQYFGKAIPDDSSEDEPAYVATSSTNSNYASDKYNK